MINTFRCGAGWLLLVTLAAFTQPAFALGLGNASVESYLNQPLRVRITLLVREGDDLGKVTAGLASAEDFALIGADREAISVPLSFAIEQNGNATAILVTSVLPVKDPVLRLIVEVNWPSGRMLREYTLFLDPPTFAEPAPSPVIDQRTKPPVTDTSPMTGSGQKAQAELAPAPPSAETPEGAQKAARTTAGNETPASVAEGDEYGPVQGGDTLWRIASNWSRGTGLDMSTVMIAIQRNNPHAFINSNINLLKQGIILRMPDSEDLAQISINEARSEVQEQNQASGRELVSPAVETPLVDEQSEPPATTSGTAEVEQPEGKLELVPPSESSDAESAYGSEEDSGEAVASTSVETLREEVARKEEALIVEQQQNEYLQQRIAELEVQAAAQQANVANDNLAGMEERLRGERLAKEAAARAGTAPSGRPQPVTPKKSTAWYSSKLVWLISLLVLGLAAYGGFLARRSFRADTVSNATGAGGGTHGGVKGEAAGIPKIMVPAKNKPAAEISGVTSGGRQVTSNTAPARAGHVEDAEVLDEDSADPEVRLDLARAYISMGDKEAARVILAEVVEHGTTDQQLEAKAMLGEI